MRSIQISFIILVLLSLLFSACGSGKKGVISFGDPETLLGPGSTLFSPGSGTGNQNQGQTSNGQSTNTAFDEIENMFAGIDSDWPSDNGGNPPENLTSHSENPPTATRAMEIGIVVPGTGANTSANVSFEPDEVIDLGTFPVKKKPFTLYFVAINDGGQDGVILLRSKTANLAIRAFRCRPLLCEFRIAVRALEEGPVNESLRGVWRARNGGAETPFTFSVRGFGYTQSLAMGATKTGGPVARTFDLPYDNDRARFVSPNQNLREGAGVAIADFDGNGIRDLAAAGGDGKVRIYQDRTDNVYREIEIYDGAEGFPVNLAVYDFNGDKRPEIIVAPDKGGSPRIQIYDVVNGNKLADYFAFNEDFRGGARISGGEYNGEKGVWAVPGEGGGAILDFHTASGAPRYHEFFGDNQAGSHVVAGTLMDLNNVIISNSGEIKVFKVDGQQIRQREAFRIIPNYTGPIPLALMLVNYDWIPELLISWEGRGGHVGILDFRNRKVLGKFSVFNADYTKAINLSGN